jgi:hypothetical protein
MFETYDKVKTFAAFEGFVDYVQETDRLLEITTRAFLLTTGLGRLAKVLNKDEKTVADFEKTERLAAEEVKNGFPLLYAHSVVALWSALEAAIPRFCVDWLMCFPHFLEGKSFAKVSLAASSAILEDKRTIMEEVVQMLDQVTHSPLRAGVGRFDLLLAAVGISITHDEDRRRTLFELSKVRNVVVHQAGKADKKFVSECPWMNIAPGRPVVIDEERFRGYVRAALGYSADIAEKADEVARGLATEHAHPSLPVDDSNV